MKNIIRKIKIWWINVVRKQPRQEIRDHIKKHVHRRFPPPVKTHRGKLIVPNALGKRYFNKDFPSWMMWSETSPNIIYINIDMFVLLAEDMLKSNVSEIDLAKVEAYKLLSLAIAESFFTGHKQNMPEFMFHYATSKYSHDICKANPKCWFDSDQIATLRTFSIGQR